MKKTLRIIFFLFCIFYFSLLISDTIIDSVYSNPSTDGFVFFNPWNQSYNVITYQSCFHAGDQGEPVVWWMPNEANSTWRSFFSFELSVIPVGYYVDSAYVRLYQYESWGYNYTTGTTTNFPVWNLPSGNLIKCVLSHIDYGNILDEEDWGKGDYGNPYTYQHNIGVITDSADVGYRYLDVTSSLIQDYELGRDKSQYRISFQIDISQIDTDWDDHCDVVSFRSADVGSCNELKPTLYLIFSDEINSIENNELSNSNYKLQNYPNPFKPSGAGRSPVTTISFSLEKDAENAEIIIYNLKGQKVKILQPFPNPDLSGGTRSVQWDGKDNTGKAVSSGIYLYQLKVGGKQVDIKKCLLLK